MTGTIALVGRTNVGKSTLFNRLTGRKKALVHDRPGVTRDRREGQAVLYSYPFTVIDTAGLEQNGALAASMWKQTEKALAQADAIAFIVDVRAGVTPLDKETGRTLRRVNKPVILVANKAEGREQPMQELYALGFGDGLASLVGKLCGRIRIPFTNGKTVAGSLACFTAIFCSTVVLTGNPKVALGCALVGMAFELLPLRDLDNLVIPIVIASVCQFYFHV